MKDMKEELDSLLQKEMDRKDFLKLVGVSFVAMTGIVSVLKTLNSLGGTSVSSSKQAGGYGSSAYGGERKTRQLG
jgi:hypothetical protein